MDKKTHTPESLRPELEGLYKAYEKKLCGYAVKVYKLNEDSAREVFYKAIYKIAESVNKYVFENPNKKDAFVFKVFVNFLKNHLRDNKSPGTVYLEDIKTGIAQQDQISHPNVKLDLLTAELAKLEDWERLLLLLRSQEMSYSEISKYTGKPQSQLKVYYQRLKNRLSEKLNAIPEFNSKQK